MFGTTIMGLEDPNGYKIYLVEEASFRAGAGVRALAEHTKDRWCWGSLRALSSSRPITPITVFLHRDSRTRAISETPSSSYSPPTPAAPRPSAI